MIYIFLGPPGSGKGTQAKKLAQKLNIPHVALGDILREAVREGTEVGRLAKTFIEAGNLVPDHVTIKITGERLQKGDCKNGLILDGFPRSIVQAEALDKIMAGKDYMVIYFKVPLEAVIDRNSGRLSCPDCGSVFHIRYNSPGKEGICDKCGGKLYQRKDDSPEVIKNRFTVYEESTKPVFGMYEKRGKLVTVDAQGSIDEVFTRLLKAINL